MTDTPLPACRKGVPDPRCKVYCAGHSCGRWCDEHVCGEACPRVAADAVKIVPEDVCKDEAPCEVCELATDLNTTHGELYLLRQTLRDMLSAYDNDLSSPWDVVDALRDLLDEEEG